MNFIKKGFYWVLFSLIFVFVADRIYTKATLKIFELQKRGYDREQLTKQFKKEFMRGA